MSTSDNLKKTFEEAIGYPTVKVDTYSIEKLKDAIEIAENLKNYLSAYNIKVEKSFTLNINGNDYHTTSFKFTHIELGECTAEVTIPMKYSKYHRIWTKNENRKFVWSTLDDIKNCKAEPQYIFYYLSQQFHLIPDSVGDDLPFGVNR